MPPRAERRFLRGGAGSGMPATSSNSRSRTAPSCKSTTRSTPAHTKGKRSAQRRLKPAEDTAADTVRPPRPARVEPPAQPARSCRTNRRLDAPPPAIPEYRGAGNRFPSDFHCDRAVPESRSSTHKIPTTRKQEEARAREGVEPSTKVQDALRLP